MNLSRTSAVVLLAAFAGAAAAVFLGQTPPPGQVPFPGPSSTAPSSTAPPVSPLIVLDPAHGGSDSGAILGNRVAEKDVTLALAARIRSALASAGFTVVATRDAEISDPLTTDQRAEIANRAHALACIVLHATATGSGVHIYTSELQPPDEDTADSDSAFVPTPWDMAQAQFVPQSKSFADSVAASLGKGHIPSLSGSAPVRPLDNLMCPAIAIEIAPLTSPDSGPVPVTDASYQQQLAISLASALQSWRSQSLSPAAAAGIASQIEAQAGAIAAAEATGHAAAKARASSASLPQKGGQ